jgi:transcriptional regulator with XRE-family HTH domain
MTLLAGELLERRLSLGLSQQQVAAAGGVARSTVGKIERGEIGAPDPEDLGAIAAVLGLRIRIGTYPDGDPIADRVQVPLLGVFRGRLGRGIGWRIEVPLPTSGDPRAWDAVIEAEGAWGGVEAVARMGAVDATVRRALLKLRDDPRVNRLILVVLDTARNRDALGLAERVLRADFPLDTRAVLGALGAGRLPPANGIVLLRLPPAGTRPQDLHTVEKPVDDRSGPAPRFVDKPIGGRASGT